MVTGSVPDALTGEVDLEDVLLLLPNVAQTYPSWKPPLAASWEASVLTLLLQPVECGLSFTLSEPASPALQRGQHLLQREERGDGASAL